MVKNISGKKRKLIAFFVLFLAGILWIFWANNAVVLTTMSLSSDELPPAFDGFRIAHISDLHNEQFGKDNHKLLETIASIEPDIIVITGDIVDSTYTDTSIALSFARRAVEIAPVYYVTGNHESRIANIGIFLDELTFWGIRVLRDEVDTIERKGEFIQIIGLDDPNFSSGEKWLRIPGMINDSEDENFSEEKSFSLVLSHRPELFNLYCMMEANLVLCGHAHGGQIRLPFIGGIYAPNQGFFPSYDSGCYTKGATSMIVSRGLGNRVIIPRINNRPEVILIELHSVN